VQHWPPVLIDDERRKTETKARYNVGGIAFTPFMHAVEQPTEPPNVLPDTNVEIQEPSTAGNQHIENTQTVGLDSAQPETELIDEEEECAGFGETTIEALPTDEQVLKQGCEVDDVSRATENTPDTAGSIMEAISAHSIQHTIQSELGVAAEMLACTTTAMPIANIHQYALPVLLLILTDRPPPQPGEDLPDARSILDTSKPCTSLRKFADVCTTVR
jgi:hypothetical protein